MTDIVERLRARKCFWLNGAHWMMGTAPDADCAEAADEIERLKAERDAYHESNERLAAIVSGKNAEIERLRKRYEFQVEANRSLVEACGKAMDANDRLLAALTHISEHGDMPPDQLAMVALRALEPKP